MVPKRNIPEIRCQVKLKEVMGKENYLPGNILTEFDKARDNVVIELLTYLLDREPQPKDYELIDLVESDLEGAWREIYYCDVKIGRVVGETPEGLIKAVTSLEGIFIYFFPEEEYKNDI